MKPKINEINVKYIECGNCGFEKSCPLPEEIKYGRFDWVCRQCNWSWTASVRDGDFQIEENGAPAENDRYVLVRLSQNLVPWIMQAQRLKPGEDGEMRAELSATLYLLPVEEFDAENNPKGFDAYASILFKPQRNRN